MNKKKIRNLRKKYNTENIVIHLKLKATKGNWIISDDGKQIFIFDKKLGEVSLPTRYITCIRRIKNRNRRIT